MKFMYHAIKAKEILTAMIFLLVSILKKHDDLNEKEYKAKSEQIIEKTLFQRIRNALLKAKKQYKLIREKKTLR